MTEIVNCPFCGGIATVGGLVPWVECQSCGASGPQKTTEAEAIAAWNTRHGAGDADLSAELTTAWMAGAERERERAAEDSARLDWLIEREARALKFADGYQVFSPLYCQDRRYPTAREAIDAARAGERG